VLPRAWTFLFAEMIGEEPEDEIPPAWLASAEGRTGARLTGGLGRDVEPAVPEDHRTRADEEGHRVVDTARALVGGA